MDVAGDRRTLLQCHWKLRASWGPAMASEGPMGRDTSCNGASFSLSDPDVEVVGAQQALFGMGPEGEGSCQPSTVGEEALGEGGANPPALWTLADTRSTSWLAGVPTMASSSSWCPSHSRWAAYHFISAASLSFLRSLNKKNTSISNEKVMKIRMKMLRKIGWR